MDLSLKTLKIELDDNFESSLKKFRNLTSRIRTINKINYPAVYLSDADYGGLQIKYGSGSQLSLIVNLEFYYVYGFFLDDEKVYAFKGEAEEALSKFGFSTETIPYGDGYFDIKNELSEEEFYALLNTNVELNQIISGLDQLADTSIAFEKKAKSVLTVFWSLVEGIRFDGISNVVWNLIQNQPNVNVQYCIFYDLAEVWSDLCVKAVKVKIKNPSIAVYDLDRIDEEIVSNKK